MKTPTDLTIEPREIAFGREAPHPRWWLADDPVATAFYNALSITFPLGERFFMDAVRHYRDRTPPVLQGQINAFLKQEAMHSREHVFFNKQLTDHGYDIGPAEKRLEWRINLSRKSPPAMQLAATAALEHFTAIMAHEVLFTYTITRNVADLFHQDRINTLGTWGRLIGYLWGSPGLLRSIVPAYFAYYRPGFHPWEVDDRDLLAPIQGELAAG